MPVRPSIAILAGALLTAIIALIGAERNDTPMAEALSAQAAAAIEQAGGTGVTANFYAYAGSPTRHPVLSGGADLDEATRDRVAKAVAAVPGVGGVHWTDGSMRAQAAQAGFTPLHCQDDVEALLRARTIRFEESSSDIEASSRELVDEVAAALRPCLGSIIAITGHTDSSGPEPGNLALSRERADAVRRALINRGIPADGLRASGVGSSIPVEGLDPADPANRRIEFSVIATVPLEPTPVDTPGPR
ncbi:MAG: OmpA family protein [Sphingomonadaceae bacterium]|nr:OmpA family protein [Sphingomonadaceae bacterium]